LAWWEAATTGRAEAYRQGAELQTRIENLLADPARFKFLREQRDSRGPAEPEPRRLLEVLYLAYLGRQCSTDLLREIVELSTDLEQRFATFRAELDGVRLSQNDVERVLVLSGNADERRRVWEASKSIGPLIAADVRRLVRLRNRAARELGFDDYYKMSLTLAEQSPERVLALFDDLEQRTREPFLREKRSLDAELARRFEIEPDQLRPWHYSNPFFQDVPEPPELRLDDLFEGRDLARIASEFFSGIGLDVEGILARSDMTEREGKNQHAFCIDIDREGDVRTLLNLTPSVRWMSTLLHELGHGVYDLGIRRDLPYPLRTPAHIFATEAVAMFFGRMPYTMSWLQGMGLLEGVEADRLQTALQSHQVRRQLVFSRWTQVMVRFESALYADPDGDLDGLWWDLVEQHQGLRRPEGRAGEDWASKIHIVSSPVYYHNYMIGELYASQLWRAISEHLAVDLDAEGRVVGRGEAGIFLRQRVFANGASVPWPEHVESATGRPLSVEDYATQFG
jgi:peptidyl-dipeptidase A